jgi:signal transduction histidine kinase
LPTVLCAVGGEEVVAIVAKAVDGSAGCAAATGRAAYAHLDGAGLAVIIADVRDDDHEALLAAARDRRPDVIRVAIGPDDIVGQARRALDGLAARHVTAPATDGELAAAARWAIEAWRFGRGAPALHGRIVETERLATLGGALRSVVHDLGQPLSALSYNAEHLTGLQAIYGRLGQLVAGAPLSAVDRRAIDELTAEIEQLGELVMDVQRSAAMLAAKVAWLVELLTARPGSARTDTAAIARLAIAWCEHDARSRGVDLRLEAGEPPPATAVAAADLFQVLLGILTDATARARSRGGSGTVTVSARAVGSAVHLAVRQPGSELAPDAIATARYQRALGAGGAVVIANEPVGTVVTIVLPRAE